MPGVDYHGAGAHSQSVQARYDGLELLSTVDGQKTHDVFEHDDPRQTALGLQDLHQVDEGPESARSRPIGSTRVADAEPVARSGKVLARERRPGEIRAATEIV